MSSGLVVQGLWGLAALVVHASDLRGGRAVLLVALVAEVSADVVAKPVLSVSQRTAPRLDPALQRRP